MPSNKFLRSSLSVRPKKERQKRENTGAFIPNAEQPPPHKPHADPQDIPHKRRYNGDEDSK